MHARYTLVGMSSVGPWTNHGLAHSVSFVSGAHALHVIQSSVAGTTTIRSISIRVIWGPGHPE